MELREWQYMNKPAGNVVSNSSSVFRSRLKKLAGYAYRYKNSKVTSVDILKLTDNEIKFAEFFESEATAEFEISITPTTEDWNLKIYTNNSYEGRKQILDASGTGWVELLKELRYYITIPTTGTPDYKDLLIESLLNEWTLMSPPAQQAQAVKASSSGYKKRFEKLIKYHIDHASSELESVTKKDIRDSYFHLTEHYNDGREEFDRDIVASYDKASGTFFFRIFIDGKETYESKLSKSYEDFVKTIEAYMFLPDSRTLEYDDLLVEWVAMKNSSTTSQASTKTNKEKFKELTNYMIANANFASAKKVSKAEVIRLDDYGFTYKEAVNMNGQDFILTLLVSYGNKHNPASTAWKSELYMDTDRIREDRGNGMEELLQAIKGNFKVPTFGSPECDSICESISIADDFKAYENLWD